MGNPIDSAAKGLAQSQAQLAKSAQRLVESAARGAGAGFERQLESASLGSSDRQANARTSGAKSTGSNAPKGRPAGAALQGQGAYIPSLAEETVQMRIAANTYRANARMIEAADDVLKMTIDMMRKSDKKNNDQAGDA
ncbi:MAG: hypothetical protein AAF607_10115 [Pseudomonadota bacterium]